MSSYDRSRTPTVGAFERARQNFLIELHQRRFPASTQRDTLVNPTSLPRLPKAWCGTGSDTTLAAGDSLTVDVTIDTDQTHVIAIATIQALNTSAAGVVTWSGWFRSAGSDLNGGTAMAEKATWANGEQHTYSAACLIESGATVGFKITNDGGTSREISLDMSVQVIEVSAQSAACCNVGA